MRLAPAGGCGTTGAASFPTRREWVLTDTWGCNLTGGLFNLRGRALQTAFAMFMGGRLGWCGHDLKISREGPFPCLALPGTFQTPAWHSLVPLSLLR